MTEQAASTSGPVKVCFERPRANRLEEVLEAKRLRLKDPNQAPLADFAARLRTADRDLPDFDPLFGGVQARALVLLEAPGGKAVAGRRGSGFVSVDNDDDTAELTWNLLKETGLQRGSLLFWNIVPWYLGDRTRIAAASASDIAEAADSLRGLLTLLADLRVVLTLGNAARDGWLRVLLSSDFPLVPTLAAVHPSPRVLRPHPERRVELATALTKVRKIVTA